MSSRRVFFARQAEDWLHQHGPPNHPEAAAIKHRMRDVFYCDQDDWKTEVLRHARSRLTGLPRPDPWVSDIATRLA